MPVIGPAVDLMLLWTPAFFCALSRMLGHEAYVFGRPSDYSSLVGPQKLGGRVVKIGAIGARRAGYAKREGLRNAPGYPGLRLAQLHSFAAEH